LSVVRRITSSLHQAETGARRAPLKKGAEVPVSARLRDIHVIGHIEPGLICLGEEDGNRR
jgi:hypothetical protein